MNSFTQFPPPPRIGECKVPHEINFPFIKKILTVREKKKHEITNIFLKRNPDM